MTFPREYNVTDPTLERLQAPSLEEQEEIFKEARLAKQKGTRITDGAKKRVEFLLEMFRAEHTVTIRGQEFVLRSLKNAEAKEATKNSIGKVYELEISMEARTQFLARSIVSIAKVPFEDILQSNKVEDKVAFLDELDEVMVLKLWSEFQIMNEKVKQEFGLSKPEVMQEVADDLKK